ncbi:Scr1 family TA system antitoxin-like transcriptional regulator [Actinoallomurus rhizosphaericola]|uniref:Scr1 family TA system antitoxin-like transcriptional regulator n=1 Tax=Actinoallomurus rhizosphaericola TaxID=2952536 RepID=UPI003872E29D
MTELSKKAQDDSTPFGDRIELEQRADAIYEYDMRLVPGLLQTKKWGIQLRRGHRVVRRSRPLLRGRWSRRISSRASPSAL